LLQIPVVAFYIHPAAIMLLDGASLNICSICSRIDDQGHVANAPWPYVNSSMVPHERGVRGHSWACSFCGTHMSGLYTCVLNSSNMCVGAIFVSEANGRGNTRPNIGCGVHAFDTTSPRGISATIPLNPNQPRS
jgi:hypothetical protein